MEAPANLLYELSEIIGPQSTTRLIQHMGGAQVYIPKRPKTNHPLTVLLGKAKSQKLCDYYSGEILHFPPKKSFRELRNQLLKREYQRLKCPHGSRADQLAQKYGLSRRQVLYIVKERN